MTLSGDDNISNYLVRLVCLQQSWYKTHTLLDCCVQFQQMYSHSNEKKLTLAVSPFPNIFQVALISFVLVILSSLMSGIFLQLPDSSDSVDFSNQEYSGLICVSYISVFSWPITNKRGQQIFRICGDTRFLLVDILLWHRSPLLQLQLVEYCLLFLHHWKQVTYQLCAILLHHSVIMLPAAIVELQEHQI